MQRLLELLYPPACILCAARVESDFGLCPACFRDTPFVVGPACDACGAQLMGDEVDEGDLCNECHALGRPWARGRAVMRYDGNGRRLVMALKHGDRTELARPAARWLGAAARPLIGPDTLICPVPLHPWRLVLRKFNQAALLAVETGRLCNTEVCVDLIDRTRNTPSQGRRSRADRIENLRSAFSVAPRHSDRIKGRPVLLVDDVMTTGATLSACTDACLVQGARSVDVLVLARVQPLEYRSPDTQQPKDFVE